MLLLGIRITQGSESIEVYQYCDMLLGGYHHTHNKRWMTICRTDKMEYIAIAVVCYLCW